MKLLAACRAFLALDQMDIRTYNYLPMLTAADQSVSGRSNKSFTNPAMDPGMSCCLSSKSGVRPSAAAPFVVRNDFVSMHCSHGYGSLINNSDRVERKKWMESTTDGGCIFLIWGLLIRICEFCFLLFEFSLTRWITTRSVCLFAGIELEPRWIWFMCILCVSQVKRTVWLEM